MRDEIERVSARVCALLTSMVAVCLLTACDVPEGAGAPRGQSGYVTRPAEIGDIREIIPAVGPVRAATEVEIGAEVTGRILEIHADFNDPVSAGDLLARIDPAPFESAVAQAQAVLAAREAAVRSAAASTDDARAGGPAGTSCRQCGRAPCGSGKRAVPRAHSRSGSAERARQYRSRPREPAPGRDRSGAYRNPLSGGRVRAGPARGAGPGGQCAAKRADRVRRRQQSRPDADRGERAGGRYQPDRGGHDGARHRRRPAGPAVCGHDPRPSAARRCVRAALSVTRSSWRPTTGWRPFCRA